MGLKKLRKRGNNAASKPVSSEKETDNSSKPEIATMEIDEVQNSTQGNDTETNQQVQVNNETEKETINSSMPESKTMEKELVQTSTQGNNAETNNETDNSSKPETEKVIAQISTQDKNDGTKNETEKKTENTSKAETEKSVAQTSTQDKNDGTENETEKKIVDSSKAETEKSVAQTSTEDEKKSVNSSKPETEKAIAQTSTQDKNDGTKSHQVEENNETEKKSINSSNREIETMEKAVDQICTQGNEAVSGQQVEEINENKTKILTQGNEAGTGQQIEVNNENKSKILTQGNEEAGTSQQNEGINKNKRKIITQGKEVENQNNNKRKRRRKWGNELNKDKNIVTEKHEEIKNNQNGKKEVKRDNNNVRKELGGVIFMCNAKTKQDCFGYQIMGVTNNKKELVMKIRPGLKLFLYDFDLKLLYGIFEASSPGGMRLEPAAFGGGFPVQVRFIVEKDCFPLPEAVFKKAIKENYDEKTRKFNTELSFEQVKRLKEMFQPVTLRSPSVHVSMKPPSSRSQLFLSEKEYRNYGLPQIRPTPLPVLPAGHGNREKRVERNQVGLNYPSESEYRTYRIRRPPQEASMVSNTYDESTTSLVNRYLAMPRIEQREVGQPQRLMVDQGMMRPSYDSRGPPPLNYNNQRFNHLGVGGQLGTEVPGSVSSRYSFAGPSVPRK